MQKMKFITTIFKIIGFLLLLMVMASAAILIYKTIDKVDAFYVKNADFSNYEHLSNLDAKLISTDNNSESSEDLSVYVHRLSKSAGTVIAYRWYSNGNTLITDDELFEKLTIWIPSLPETYPVTLDFSDTKSIKAVYTEGGSAWPSNACSGYLKSGRLTLSKRNSSIDVSVEGIIFSAGSNHSKGYCKNKRELNIQFSLHKIDFSELTPWLGLKGDYQEQETFR